MHDNIHLPEPFLNLIKSTMPSHLSMEDFVAACQRPLRRSIRVNTLKISVEQFLQRVDKYGWNLTPIPWCETGFWIEREECDATPLGNTAEHLAGLFYIQESSSMMPVTALLYNNKSPLNLVLDTAAAPGSKTTQIAAYMENKGALVANEYSSSRVKVLHANIQRCGIRNVALTNFDGRVFGSWLPEQFDAILLDAPCSGEGAIRKDIDAMKNWSIESIGQIAQTQKELIESAFQALKPGGVLVYSTCTLNLEENQEVCKHLKNTYPSSVEFESLDGLFSQANQALTKEGFLHVYPQLYDSEGFFVARIRKTSSVAYKPANKRLGKFPFNKVSNATRDSVTKSLNQQLNLTLPEGYSLWSRDNELWLFPKEIEPLIGEIRFSRIGIKLAEAHKKGFKWQHQAIVALAKGNETRCFPLSQQQAREWYMGKDIRPICTEFDNENKHPTKGDVLLTYNSDIIGIGKWVGNRIKNGLPRDLVKDNNLF